jgi:diaminopropionate ammonia-lyase
MDIPMNSCAFAYNRFRQSSPDWPDELTAAFSAEDILPLHRSLPGYHPTPVVRLPALAESLSVKDIIVKDESHRFDLKAFKVMGASYAIYRFLKDVWHSETDERFDIKSIIDGGPDGPWAGRYTFCTATDGNHGRAVAWTAKRLFQRAVIYMPKGTVPARIRNIEKEGARVEIVDGTYDEGVRRIAEDAETHGWQVISDTAYPGYTTIPKYIMAGYTTMFREMETEIHADSEPGVDFIFLQAGVGSFAAAAAWYYVSRYGPRRPKMISVEPVEAACMLASISTQDGTMTTSHGSFRTIMAGLNCGTPSISAWPFLRDGFDLIMAVTDDYAIDAMRRYYHPLPGDQRIISGESGAAGLAALLALMNDNGLRDARDALGLGPDSRILLFNTEGDTDPDHFARVVAR